MLHALQANFTVHFGLYTHFEIPCLQFQDRAVQNLQAFLITTVSAEVTLLWWPTWMFPEFHLLPLCAFKERDRNKTQWKSMCQWYTQILSIHSQVQTWHMWVKTHDQSLWRGLHSYFTYEWIRLLRAGKSEIRNRLIISIWAQYSEGGLSKYDKGRE